MTDNSDEPGSLMTRTLELLDASPRTIPEIYRETGISFYWLRKFKQREVKNPSVNRVQRLYEFLSASAVVLR